LKDSGRYQQQNREYRTICLHSASTAARTLGTPQPLSFSVLILTSVILCDSFKFEKRSQLFVGADDEPLFRRGATSQSRDVIGGMTCPQMIHSCPAWVYKSKSNS